MRKWFLGSFPGVFKNFISFVITLVLTFVSTPPSLWAQTQDRKRSLDSDRSKIISMEFKGANLSDVLKILSQQSGLNFIAAMEVNDKKITLYLNQVSVDEALERILYANDLTYDMEEGSGIFIVKPRKAAEELLTRIYRLKYASTSSSKINSTISISSSSSGSSSSGSSSSGSSSSGSSSSGSSSSGSSSSGSSTGSSSSPSGGSASSSGTSSSSSGGIAGALQAALSSFGKIVEDPRTNSLIITDLPTQFPMIEQILSRLDVPIPQILIEVEMLDVSKTTADKIGVKYGDTPLTFKGAERDHYYPWDQNELKVKGLISVPAPYRVGTISAAGLTATLQFLRTQTDTKNLARPRILTLNNQTAEIKIATNEAIGIQNTISASTALSTSALQAERVQTGVFLTVTPQASILTGEITMAIVPKVIQARLGGTFEGKTFKDPEERGSQSILKVDSGDTIMLGGLLRTDYSNTITKIPLLGDIPFIGGAFRHKDKNGSERELIIFITPHIIREDSLSKSTSKKYIVSSALNSVDTSSNPQPVVNNPEVNPSIKKTESKTVIDVRTNNATLSKKKDVEIPTTSRGINFTEVSRKQNFSARQKEIDKALSTIEKREP